MIPRIVHQTFKAKEAIKSVDRLRMKTWEALNPTWTVMLWDDQACTTFVKSEYPDMYPAYAGRLLPVPGGLPLWGSVR